MYMYHGILLTMVRDALTTSSSTPPGRVGVTWPVDCITVINLQQWKQPGHSLHKHLVRHFKLSSFKIYPVRQFIASYHPQHTDIIISN